MSFFILQLDFIQISIYFKFLKSFPIFKFDSLGSQYLYLYHQKMHQKQVSCTLDKASAYELKSKEILQQTLAFSDLNLPQQIDYRAVKIFQNDHLHQIYTKTSNTNLPHLVLLHGFGGTGMTFVRMFKRLKDYFQVHALDGFGIGHSSKGKFQNDFTYQEARDYFIDAVEEWRKSLDIQQFVLLGHSFGGYLSVCYIQKYGKRVTRLILLSPVGTTEKTPEEVQQEMRRRTENSWKGKLFMYFAEKVFSYGFRPSKIMGSWFIGQKLINRIVQQRLKLEDEEKETWKEYFRQLSKMDENSEYGFYIMFKWPLIPKHTIEAILNRIEYPQQIEFYFGQIDWMDNKGAKKLASKYQNISFGVISNAGHQLIFDNPDEICLNIISKEIKLKQKI